MVIRRRARAFLIPLFLYAVSAGLVGYFIHHAHTGTRGTEAKRALKTQVVVLEAELETANAEKAEWEHRIGLLKADQIDRDLLEERARTLIGMVHKNDVVIMGQ
ncbi:septum formation initiator family protein [Microvirga sp. W0021]|uniref:Septum formation initiator family protein n=1 Tax=Hohaiivirga grylli TaxID=3133970 RepID=A0ABV0BKN5_9HYPH